MAKHINIKNKKKFLTLLIAVIAVVVAIILVISLLGKKKDDEQPEEEGTSKYDSVVASSIEELKIAWKQTYDGIAPLYDNGTFKSDGKEDRIIEIKNVRVMVIDSDSDMQLKNVKYVVEFDLYSNRFRTAPYLLREDVYNTAVVFNDGHVEIYHSNLLDGYLELDPPDSNHVRELVSEVVDLGDKFNKRIELD